MYLPALAKPMEYDVPDNPEDAYAFWQQFSRAMIYRSRNALVKMADQPQLAAQGQPRAPTFSGVNRWFKLFVRKFNRLTSRDG